MEQQMSSDLAASPSGVGPPPRVAVSGQVCDRCRQRKVKCDGTLPSCKSCKVAGVPCVVSAKLRRRTKIRGFHTSLEEELASLKLQNDELRKLLELERTRNDNARVQESQSISPAPNQFVVTPMEETRHRTASTAQLPAPLEADHMAFVIKHMGRLVPDYDGVERFAGSTTGVHFVLSVQQALQRRGISAWFPENSFRLHIITRSKLSLPTPGNGRDTDTQVHDTISALCQLTPDFISKEVRRFVAYWSFICPAVAPMTLVRRLVKLLARSQQRDAFHHHEYDHTSLFQFIIILLINETDTVVAELDQLIPNERQSRLLEVAGVLLPYILSGGQLSNLQSLVLLAFFYQLKGQHTSNIQLRGIVLQMAQSLGLHRHSRRFRFSKGEVELRKRLWWIVYNLDKSIAIIHGLPQTIHDADVDVDYPCDGELEDISDTGLSLPLPGEDTPVRDFIALCHLTRIFSSILSQLYTTTDRRGGPEKIRRLDQQLRTWNQLFNDEHEMSPDAAVNFGRCKQLSSLWLLLMNFIAKLLIHRPGLTFDPTTPHFQECLGTCVETSSHIIELTTTTQLQALGASMHPMHSLVFQCALMHIFLHCSDAEEKGHGGKFVRETSAHLVSEAIEYLCRISCADDTRDLTRFTTAIIECVELLRSLAQIIFDQGPTVSTPGRYYCSANTAMPAGGLQLDDNAPRNGVTSFMSESALDYINHFESLNWVLDGQFSPSMPMDYFDM